MTNSVSYRLLDLVNGLTECLINEMKSNWQSQVSSLDSHVAGYGSFLLVFKPAELFLASRPTGTHNHILFIGVMSEIFIT